MLRPSSSFSVRQQEISAVSTTGDVPSTVAPVVSLLRKHFLFREFDPKILEQLASRATRRSIPRGSAVFAKGDEGTGLFGILAGTVKICTLSAQGSELVVALIKAGEVFGEIALLDGQPRTADATAQTNCELRVIERRDFLPFLGSHPDVSIKTIEVLCERFRRTTGQLEDSMFLSLPNRLAKALLQLSTSAGKTSSG